MVAEASVQIKKQANERKLEQERAKKEIDEQNGASTLANGKRTI